MADPRCPEDYAVVVGIDSYPRLPRPLNGAANDMEAFCAWLVDPTGGGLDPANLQKLRSPPMQEVPPYPGNDVIDSAFEKLINLAPQRGGRVGRRLYIFLAGHGFAVDVVLDSRLLAATGGPGATRNHVYGQRYAEWFQKAKYFDEVVLIMDCCRENFPSTPGRDPPWDAVIGHGPDVLFTYLFATKAFASARELEFPENGAKTHRGVFTNALLSVLQASRRPLSGAELRDLVNNQMIALYEQFGPQDSAPRQEAECFSSPRAPLLGTEAGGARVQFIPSPARIGQELLIRDGNAGRKVLRKIACAGPFEVVLDPGLYSIEGPGLKHLFEVLANEGQSVDI